MYITNKNVRFIIDYDIIYIMNNKQTTKDDGSNNVLSYGSDTNNDSLYSDDCSMLDIMYNGDGEQ